MGTFGKFDVSMSIFDDQAEVQSVVERLMTSEEDLLKCDTIPELQSKINNIVFEGVDFITEARKMYLEERDKHRQNIKDLLDLIFDRKLYNESLTTGISQDDGAVKDVLFNNHVFSYFKRYSHHEHENISDEVKAKEIIMDKILVVIENLDEETKKLIKKEKNNFFNELDYLIEYVVNILFSKDGKHYETVEWLEKIIKHGVKEFDKDFPNTKYDTLDNFITYITDYDFTEKEIAHFLQAIRRIDLYDLMCSRQFNVILRNMDRNKKNEILLKQHHQERTQRLDKTVIAASKLKNNE